jgi:hypothetical protein
LTLDIATPALLFPAITLLLLAYTNRFLALATLIRGLHTQYKKDNKQANVLVQIKNLRSRVNLVRRMQAFGVLSFILTVLCMFALFQDAFVLSNYLFGASLFALVISLVFSFIEIQISTKAINVELSDMEFLDTSGK